MKAHASKTADLPAGNIVQLEIVKRRKTARVALNERFTLQTFSNRGGTFAWRVSGYMRDGTRIRENFADEQAARCRRIELESEFHAGQTETAMRATKLTHEQVQLAEVAIIKLGEDWLRLLDAVDHWKRSGKSKANAESPRLDDAVDQYLAWLAASPLRDATKRHWRIRMTLFKNTTRNLRVADVTPETIDAFLASRKVSASGKDTDRRAVSRFFSWCIERPRRWTVANPCREVRVEMGEAKPPEILSVEDCGKLLAAAEAYKGGLLAPYVAVCLFAGLRPFEAARLPRSQVNLADGEIRLEPTQTKTKRARVVTICATLKAWLKRYTGETFPANWRKEFDAVRKAAGLTAWPADVLRHTAVSHFFRLTGSYGQTAEQFGNSEAIIKAHYQARVSGEDTKRFYALLPGGSL